MADSGQTQPVSGPQAAQNEAPQAKSAPSSQPPQGTFNPSTKISSLDELQKVAPKVYDQMMKGIAQNIISDMREHMERYKKLMHEMERANERQS